MTDSLQMSGSSKNLATSTIATKKISKICHLVSAPKSFSQRAFDQVVSIRHGGFGVPTGQIIVFLVKLAALEIVRRFSKARVPILWRSLQGLQFLTYPPFRWIKRWTPFKHLIHGVEKLSRPVLLLSIATSFSDISFCGEEASESLDIPQQHSELSDGQYISDERICSDAPETSLSENWVRQLHEELEKQGIVCPERINEDELHRFYKAANGDFSSFLSSIKRTIQWRQTYNILSPRQLEQWSQLVFWHGYDMNMRPCLVIRLGLACSYLPFQERPRFSQAIVSQIEFGVLHLVNEQDMQITVLMDCEGVSALKFPMQMLRSFSSLVQDHFPNRLNSLFLIRLPPVVRVAAQTLVQQVLKPITQKKLRIEGESYLTVLSTHLQTIPMFLGGDCKCTKCTTLHIDKLNSQSSTQGVDKAEPHSNSTSNEQEIPNPCLDVPPSFQNYENFLRTVVLGFLMLWIFIVLLAGMNDL